MAGSDFVVSLIKTPRAGFEPATTRLTAGCSTVELSRNDNSITESGSSIQHQYKKRKMKKMKKMKKIIVKITGYFSEGML